MTLATNEPDWVLLGEEKSELDIRPKPILAGDVKLELHPTKKKEGVLVSIHPPKAPAKGLKRVPVDIVLVIDVSWSMISAAPLPTAKGEVGEEDPGLCVLDLVKHAARTIIDTLDENDRLGVVAFSSDAECIQELLPMDTETKKASWSKISELSPVGSTNLWAGLRTGYDLFGQTKRMDNVAALFLLTDGMPNHMEPQQGYVPKLKPRLEKSKAELKYPPLIHTFGFGYRIRSGLLQSLAEIGGGNYAFIPDVGMIGTVFVHAVANLYATFATSVTLKLHTIGTVELETQTGAALIEGSGRDLVINLSTLQFGQSRDIFLKYQPGSASGESAIRVTLSYTRLGKSAEETSTERKVLDFTSLEPALVDYHIYRASICDFLASLFPTREDGEHVALSCDGNDLENAQSKLVALVKRLRSSGYNDNLNASLLDDLDGESPKGQVRIALHEGANYSKWGVHYLSSLLHAHRNQMCNSFKDPGPLQYGKESPLFCKYRDQLDECFGNLPVPRNPDPKSNFGSHNRVSGIPYARSFMSHYNNSSNPCFAGHCKIDLADGKSIPIRDLLPGASVWTPVGSRKVAAVVKTAARGAVLCRVGRLWITPYHPLLYRSTWVHPIDIAEYVILRSTNIYSVLLMPSRDPNAHAVKVGGHWCVTLGHGLEASGVQDVRTHVFLGNYTRVVRDLAKLPKERTGLLRCGGMRRDSLTGLVCGFRIPKPKRQHHMKATKTALHERSLCVHVT